MGADDQKLSRKDYADYEFIVREVERLLSLTPQELLKYYYEHKGEALYMLWGEGRTLPGTRACYERFDQIVARGLKSLGPESRKHDPIELRNLLVRKFVTEAQKIVADTTGENAHEIFEDVVHAARAQHRELTHYIPCTLVAQEAPDNFSIGPVSFSVRATFMKSNEQTIRASVKQGPSSSIWFDSLHGFFARFRWVSAVKVPPCDRNVSIAFAQRSVQRALDLFKLFAGSERASGVRQGYDMSLPAATSSLVSTEPGAFLVSHRRKTLDAIVSEDWYHQVTKVKQWATGERIVSAAWEKWDEVDEPYRRFLDALSWHGDAIVEADAQARILKFWTSIERVVSIKNGDPVTRRAAVMSVPDIRNFNRQFLECQKLYANRSAILHGTEGYHTGRSAKAATQTEKLSQCVLMSYLRLVDELESRGLLTRNRIRDAILGLEKISRAAPR